ncbi:hypothetical protein [Hymenobacter jeollabukensis]|uniref:Uncharacterized protein n=1 Tax=Hymenobacter jeollabukensis TaxID=2025313 RepID=A0A5R8WJS2_9BACT|nr:hypothetical protein [Hymenobacter jeollabukensis]TLM89197.1 hypothetical protein FDY95_21750 [Hymenobacter jeollabukensis]
MLNFSPRTTGPTLHRALLLTWLLVGGLLPMARAQQPQVFRPVIKNIHATADAGQDSLFKLGSTITLEVDGLGRWLHDEEAAMVKMGMSPERAHAKTRQMVLYIDDTPLRNMPPLAVYLAGTDSKVAGSRDRAAAYLTDDDTLSTVAAPDLVGRAVSEDTVLSDLNAVYDKVLFKLDRTPANLQYWDIVYGSPWKFTHPGKIGLGYDDQVFTELYPGPERSVHFQLVQPSALWIAGVGVFFLALGIIALAHRSALLRSGKEGELTSAGVPLDSTLRPFSLAKTQLAWWTFIIMSCYLVIYCVTGEMTNISMTTLSLLGISAGTAGLSGLIGMSGDVGKALPEGPETSRGWLTDILSDSNGVSINRLQKVVITVLLGYFFVRTVYKTVALPEWNNNETLLLAISSATYLGLKWQENKGPDGSASAAPTGVLTTAGGALLSTTTVTTSPALPAAPGPVVTTYTAPVPPTPDASTGAYTPVASPAASSVTVTTTTPAAPVLAPVVTAAAATGESVADPTTGAVLHREEDDMGPDAAQPGDEVPPLGAEQIPG